MFEGCTSLVNAPSLSGLWWLSPGCFLNMFRGCTSLITAPELPFTKLKEECYMYMFWGCTNLITAPQLPATTLAEYCYKEMFRECTSLVSTPTLPATTFAKGCYFGIVYGTDLFPDISKIDFSSSNSVLCGLFAGTKVTDTYLNNILPKNNNNKYYLPAESLTPSCYESMFEDCVFLNTAPELPATSLTESCY